MKMEIPDWVGEFETVQDVAASAARLMAILTYNHQLMMRDYEQKFAAIQDEIAALKQKVNHVLAKETV